MKRFKFITPQVERIMRYSFIVLGLGAAVYSVLHNQWELVGTAIMMSVLYLVPTIMEKRVHVSIPVTLQFIIMLFIFASLYLGEIHAYYFRFTWWDTMLHCTSAMLSAYIGFLLIYALNKDKHVNLILSPFFMALFSFCFALAIGVLWEIFEYTVDWMFNADMQKARNLQDSYGYFDTRLGVLDTMGDLIIDAIGALVVSVIGFLLSRSRMGKASPFWQMKDEFLANNDALFVDKEHSNTPTRTKPQNKRR